MLSKKEFLSNLYLETGKNIARFIKSRIYSQNHNDLEDCLQEVFLIAVEKAVNMDIQSHPNIKGWLFLIAKNVVSRFNCNYMKMKYNINTEVDLDLLIDNKDFTEQLIENIIYEDIDKEKYIKDLLKTLTPNEKDLFLLKQQARTNKEISVIFNISENAVASRIKRIKQKLRKIYNDTTPL